MKPLDTTFNKQMLAVDQNGPFAVAFRIAQTTSVHVSNLGSGEAAVLESLNDATVVPADYNNPALSTGWEAVVSLGVAAEATETNNTFTIEPGFYRFNVAAGTDISIGVTNHGEYC